MKLSFERNLMNYSSQINEKKFKLEGKEAEQAAKENHTTKEAEIKIYNLQRQKLEKLKKFKKFLEQTRFGNGFVHKVMNPELAKTIPTISFSDGKFECNSPDGKKKEISLSEIMTDGEWGLQYTFDESVNIHDIRKYYLEQLKSDLREKLDKQIIISETSNTYVDTLKQKAYKSIEERLGQESEQGGVIAEKMVKNFLKKLVIETNADFEIIDADVYQDVEQKVDFIIHKKDTLKNRGAQVEESETARDIGIQFTINTEKSEQKERQISSAKKHLRDMDDIVLVTLPVEQATNLYRQWNKQKQSGGPEKSWSNETKEKIFRGVMKDVFSEEEINEFCEKNFR